MAAEEASTSAGLYANYVPHDLKYDARFEDSLIALASERSTTSTGLRIIPDSSTESSVPSVSVHRSEVPALLSNIKQEELPLQLSDPRRLFASPIPGLQLTHPAGFFEGGPGLDPEIDTFSHDFLTNRPGISTSDQLQKAIDDETESSVQTFHQRMQARQNAHSNNERIEKELKALRDQHSMELKLQRRALAEHEAKKAAKDKKRREREGG